MGVPPPPPKGLDLTVRLLGNQVKQFIVWAKCALNFLSKLSFLCLSVCWLCFRPCAWVFHPDERNQPLQASSLCTDVPRSLRKKIGRKNSLLPIFFWGRADVCTQATGLLLEEIAQKGNKTAWEWKGLAHSTTYLPLSCSLPSPCDIYPPYPREEHVHRFLYFKTRVWWPPFLKFYFHD